MGFQQGLSGLNAASKQLDVIGNNVANANTVGFKQSQAQFADVYASSLTGASVNQAGLGTKVAGIAQQFTQGNITASNNPLDMAINGNGFFRVTNAAGTPTYTRNGQFHIDNNGYIVNANGLRLTGYQAVNGTVSPGAVSEIVIDTADKKPNATTKAGIQINLDSREKVKTPAFDPTDPTTFSSANYSTATTVYDSLGNEHALQTYYVKTGANTWDVYGTSSDDPAAPADPTQLGTLTFDTSGVLTPQPFVPFNVSYATGTGSVTTLDFTLDFTGTSQYGSNSGVTAMTQDGYGSGRLSGFSAGSDGVITGRYTNGQSAVLGQVVLAAFRNPNGLTSLGENQWAESAASGQPLTGAPTTGNLGVLQSSAVEDSNVDLTAELVNMITAQRVYQANAQTIKTQDQVLQTIVNLR